MTEESINETISMNEATTENKADSEKTNPTDWASVFKLALENPDAVEKIVSLFSKPFAEHKLQSLEFQRETARSEFEIAKAKEKATSSRFKMICLVIISLIIGSVVLFCLNILSGESVAFLFGTLAGCVITFAAKNEKVVVIREEPIEEE